MSKIGSSGKPPAPPRPSTPAPSSPVSSSSSQAQSVQSSKDQIPEQQPDLKAGKKTTRTRASEAHAMSVKGAQDQGQAAKQKSLLDSVSSSAGRELGNVGIIGKHVAGSVGEQAAIYGKGMLGKLKGDSPTITNIKESYGKEVAEDFKAAKKSAKQELQPLEKQEKQNGRAAMTADNREKLDRLRQLNQSFKDEPLTIAREMSQNRHDPVYKLMGPAQFASLEVTTRKMLEKSGGERFGLTTMERVGIYGYTTKDFSTINAAMRKGGPITDPQIGSYVGHINSGLAKLDDFKPAQGQSLYRGVVLSGLPPHIQSEYKPGGRLHDLSFTSTSSNKDAAFSGYDLKLTIGNTAGKGGKILPFSAHAGESEVLFPPGTKFDVVGNTPSQVAGLPPSKFSWILNVV